jgi:hypothetical protein
MNILDLDTSFILVLCIVEVCVFINLFQGGVL